MRNEKILSVRGKISKIQTNSIAGRKVVFMPGGARPGAGRKKGSTLASIIRKRAMEEGMSPLEIMIGQMRTYWARGGDKWRDKATTIAIQAAQYCHPRYAAIKHIAPDSQDNELIVRWAGVAEPSQTIDALPLSTDKRVEDQTSSNINELPQPQSDCGHVAGTVEGKTDGQD